MIRMLEVVGAAFIILLLLRMSLHALAWFVSMERKASAPFTSSCCPCTLELLPPKSCKCLCHPANRPGRQDRTTS